MREQDFRRGQSNEGWDYKDSRERESSERRHPAAPEDYEAPQARDFGQGDDQKQILVGPDGRPLDPETGSPISRSEGVSFSGLIPFFAVLGILVVGGFFTMVYLLAPGEYDPTTFGPPDKEIDTVVRDLFREAKTGAGHTNVDLFLSDFQVLEMLKHRTPPYNSHVLTRQTIAEQVINGGDFKRLSPVPFKPAPNATEERVLYEYTDHLTSSTEELRLVVARARDGWRIVAFE